MSPRGTATNLALQTDDVTVAPWTVDTVTTAAYAGPFPTGVASMRVITDTAAVSAHRVYQARSGIIPLGTRCIGSFHLARTAGTGRIICALNGASIYLDVDPATGAFGALATAIGSGGLISRGVQDLGGGLYRGFGEFYAGALDAYLQAYMNNGASVTYGNGGSPTSIAVGGFMIEIAAPGQTTPSPYAPSGATAGVGPRDGRQNWFACSDNLTKWAAVGSPTVAAGTVTAASAAAYIRQTAPTGIGASAGAPFTAQFEMMADAPCNCTTVLADITDGTPTVSVVRALTTTWQKFTMSMVTASPGAGSIGLFVGDGISGFPAGRTISVRRVQLEQSNTAGGFIATTTAPANANGAPRSLVI